MSSYPIYSTTDLLKATGIWTTVMALSTSSVFLPEIPAGFLRTLVQVCVPLIVWVLMRPDASRVNLLPIMIGVGFAMTVSMILSAIGATKRATEDPKGKPLASAFTYGGVVLAFALGMFASAKFAPKYIGMFETNA